LRRSITPKCDAAGFTLLEALVALAVVAISLSSIGLLIATTVHGTHSIEHRLAQVETTRSVATALPDRDQLVLGNFSGTLANQRWRVDVLPYAATNVDQRQAVKWFPQSIVISVRSPDGGMLQISTLRLRQRGGR
jgi:general secretion pathway protein I